MAVVTVLLVSLGAAVGAPMRYLGDRFITHRSRQAGYGGAFPLGTLFVNVLGSLVLGLLTGFTVSARLQALLGIGLCGALTTYSSFGFETVRLLERRERLLAVAYTGCTVIGTLGAALIGLAVGVAIMDWGG